MISGAKRNFEPWKGDGKEETDEERLKRLEKEEMQVDTMQELETKMVDTQRELQIADALDEIHTRNALREKINPDSVAEVAQRRAEVETEIERERLDKEDTEVARMAFLKGKRIKLDGKEASPAAIDGAELRDTVLSNPRPALMGIEDVIEEVDIEEAERATETKEVEPRFTSKRGTKRKQKFRAALGIKTEQALV